MVTVRFCILLRFNHRLHWNEAVYSFLEDHLLSFSELFLRSPAKQKTFIRVIIAVTLPEQQG